MIQVLVFGRPLHRLDPYGVPSFEGTMIPEHGAFVPTQVGTPEGLESDVDSIPSPPARRLAFRSPAAPVSQAAGSGAGAGTGGWRRIRTFRTRWPSTSSTRKTRRSASMVSPSAGMAPT